MEFKTFVFYFLAAIMVLAALRVITARNPVHAALFLVLTFFNAGGLWLLLQAEFLAVTLVMVYVGAVMVLFLFVVMMLDINLDRLREGFWSYLPVGALVGILMLVEMVMVLGGGYFGLEAMPAPAPVAADYSNTRELGRVLYTDYVYAFELASLVLLVAMVSAVALTLRKRKGAEVHPAVRAGRRQARGPGRAGEDAGRERRLTTYANKTRTAPAAAGAIRGSLMLSLSHFLILGAILFAISVVGIFLNRKNLIVLLMAIELMLLSVNMNFVAFSHYLGDIAGQVFVFFILTVAAAESAIGLAILIVMFRNMRTIHVDDLDSLKG